MDHAEARASLSDLALEPSRLRRFDRDMDLGSEELRAHLTDCPQCRAELEAWRATIAALGTAVSTAPIDRDVPATSLRALTTSDGPVALPPGLRARTLAAAQERTGSTAPRVARSRREMRLPAWLAIAAALVVVVAGAAYVVDRTNQLDQARANAAALQDVTAGLDRILQDPSHKVALLTTSAGAPAGSLSWSATAGTVVVLAGALQTPPAGQVYRCSIEQNGARVVVGEMRFSGSLAYWAGTLDSWGAAPAAGSRFLVSLEPIGGGSSGAPVLSGTL
jgi:anti-sigma factor RsiW